MISLRPHQPVMATGRSKDHDFFVFLTMPLAESVGNWWAQTCVFISTLNFPSSNKTKQNKKLFDCQLTQRRSTHFLMSGRSWCLNLQHIISVKRGIWQHFPASSRAQQKPHSSEDVQGSELDTSPNCLYCMKVADTNNAYIVYPDLPQSLRVGAS